MNNMKQLYETYQSDEQLSALARVLLWTHNTNDASSCKCGSLSPPKLSAALRVLQPAMGEAFKDHYVLEFLGLPDPHSENDLKRALVRHMKDFMLELGKDFLFVSEEYRLQVGNQDFYIDLLFYHRSLSALCAFELKIGHFKPKHNPSMGVLLCRDKDDEVVEYALSRNLSPALMAQYQLQQPDKKRLQSKLHELLAQEWGVEHEK